MKNENDCIICCYSITSKNKFITKCNHEFCRDCIENWAYETNNCPICREEDIVKFCDMCDTVCNNDIETNKGEIILCRDCQISITEVKFQLQNNLKLKHELSEYYKQLSFKEKIKFKFKKFKNYCKRKLTLKKCILFSLKSIITLCEIVLGTYSRKLESSFRPSYHTCLTIFYIVLSSLFIFVPILGTILVILSVANGLSLLFTCGQCLSEE